MSLLLFFAGAGYSINRRGTTAGVITGGTFSRKRWHDLLAAEEAQQKALERAERVRERRERAAALRAAEKAKAAIEAARAAQDHDHALAADLRALTGALNAQHGAQSIADIVRNSAAVHAAIEHARRQQEANDEDEALALLLLA